MFQFPASPTIGQVFTPLPGLDYQWNGKGWVPPSFSTASTPILHADGTLAAPGISWVNETNAGFRRVSTGTFQSVVGGNWIYGWNATGFTLNTGVGFYAGAATFSGNVTGITNAMVGLGNVVNNQQIWNYAPGNASIQMAWTGSELAYSLNGGGGSTTWPIHVTGNASGYANTALRVRHGANPGGTSMAFHWSGQGGQPEWLWGGGGGGDNMYVYNPRNFSVDWASWSDAARGIYNGGGGPGNTRFVFHWHDPGWQLNYVWGSNDGTNMYLQWRAGMNVSYANSAGSAGSANTANDSTHHEGHRVYQLCRSESSWDTVGTSGNNNDYTLMRGGGGGHIYIAQSFDHTAFRNRVFHDGSNWIYQVGGDNGYHQLNASQYCDERLKHNVADTTVDATSAIKAMRFIRFNWNYGGKEIDLGFSAQNLRSIHPEFTKTVEQPPRPKQEDLPPDAPLLPDPDPFEGLSEVMTINPDAILVYLTKALQEVLTRLDKLEAR